VVRAVRLGLIPAPDIPEKIATELASELPELLGNRVDSGVSWEVPVVVDPLTGREAPEILDVCRQRRLGEGWDLAVCLTDLPVYRGGLSGYWACLAASIQGRTASRFSETQRLAPATGLSSLLIAYSRPSICFSVSARASMSA
jgi:hypothetical protein